MDNQLDPQVVNLAKAIRQSESGGDYSIAGKSGEHGAYQFTKDTWNAEAPKYGINTSLQQATPEQQNAVAYNQIKAWKDQGKDVTQIASMWNAGQGEPNAYTGKFSDGSPSIGTNKFGAKFNVPAYAKSVATAYQTLKAGGQVQADPNNPSSVASTQNASVQPQGQSPSVGGFLSNVVSSGENAIGGIANAVMHPIKTIEGLGGMAIGAGEKIAEGLTGKTLNTDQTKSFDSLVNFYGQRYGGSNIQEIAKNILHSAYTDPVGVAMDASILLSGGEAIAGKAGAVADLEKASEIAKAGGSLADMSAAQGTSAASKIASGLGTVNDYVNPISLAGKGISGVSGLIQKGATAPLGLSTGVGMDSVSQGLKAASEGGDAQKAFVQALRGNTSPEDLVSQAKSASAQVAAGRDATYNEMLSKLGGDSTNYDISPVIKEVNNQLDNYNIGKNADGTLDFSRSKIRFNKSAQADINTIYDEMKSFGTKSGDRTALGVNNLKQAFYELDQPSSSVRPFTTAVAKATRGVLDNAPGYTDEMKNYADLTDQIKETNKSLSLGDKASIETSFKKLTSSMKNNDARLQVIKELDQATGGNLLAGVAGQRLSSILPRGITAALETGAGGLGIASMGAGGILPILGIAMTTSPRIVGEFINALGLGNQGAAKVMALLNKFRTPITGAGIAGGLVGLTPASSTNQRQQ